MLQGISNWLYEHYGSASDHEHMYTNIKSDLDDTFGIGTHSDNLLYSQKHPIITGAMLFVCNLFAQGRFEIQTRDGAVYNGAENGILKLLDRPNYYQTRIDFLEGMQWVKIARGQVVVYLKRIPGFNSPSSMYILDPHRIKYPPNFKTPMPFAPDDKRIGEQWVEYYDGDDTAAPVRIQVKDLIYIYDVPNILTPENRFRTGSRLDGLHQTLDNTVDSLIAKNIILRTNGKEMLSSDGDSGFPLDDGDEKEAKRIFNADYGLSRNRDRALITRASLRWQSLHIALRDLGLDESTKVDGNIVFTALHIPKDILSLEAKKTTYNNFRESMTSFIQNDMVSMMNDFALSLGQALLPDNLQLIGSYDHLPVMEYLNKEKADARLTQAQALNTFLTLGMDEKAALELCGLDTNITVNYEKPEPAQTTGSTNGEESKGHLRKAQ